MRANFEKYDLSAKDRGFLQELVYGICRWYGELDDFAANLLHSPIRNKDRIVHFILVTGLYQIRHLNTPAHAAVAETVSACKQLNKPWAKNLVNGCLRNALRSNYQSGITIERLTHPEWMVEEIEAAWPRHVRAILTANNERPAMCLRVNKIKTTRDDYLRELLRADLKAVIDPLSIDGIILQQPVMVNQLPGFTDGMVSVQDTAAQLACDILQPDAGHSVLDACSAPGGKAAHLLERCDNQLQLDAIDIAEHRVQRLYDTFSRLQLKANVYTADATREPDWETPSAGYDRILIDAPCSGLGVIRRHPDIRHHRRRNDIEQLNSVQQALLDNLWPLLKPGGRLLYTTCSILPQENQQQVALFMSGHGDAILAPFNHPCALQLEVGRQTLPGVHPMDGFYYCVLYKSS